MKTFITLTCLVAATLAHSIDTRQTSQSTNLDELNSARVSFYTTKGPAYELVNACSPIDDKLRLISDLALNAANHQSNTASRDSNYGMSCKIYGPSGELLITLNNAKDHQPLSPDGSNYPTDKLKMACVKGRSGEDMVPNDESIWGGHSLVALDEC
ncbi:hypothetical protein N7481_000174 [Penicillium waksmanii]|uniref:uncharacterized protein n=1 Tax=Penicillium waksmanii TaxID=69791 RepID=UPI00254673E0|nr:uncharacterized protein N7481_000174 [Penicillium waksmanii]KAJ5999765.1 hypothetical protein N7481_000174 [Penicillium waksmanii]